VRPQKVSPASSETIDVTQFAGLLDDIRDQWPLRDDGQRDGLSLFSGDVFSPSVDSSVTRGSHMVRLHSPHRGCQSRPKPNASELLIQVPVMNTLAPDISLVGEIIL
jgi:hypothetical protein